jgi:hypothetical protein
MGLSWTTEKLKWDPPDEVCRIRGFRSGGFEEYHLLGYQAV